MEKVTEKSYIHHGDNIRAIRRIIGINQYELAERMNSNQQFVSRMENKEQLDEDTLQKVAKALGVSVDFIKEYDHDSSVQNYFNNTINTVNGDYLVNPLEKVTELYERLLKEKDREIAELKAKFK